MQTNTILIDADHSLPEYTFRKTATRTYHDSEGYFATHPKLGCGKTFASEFEAIKHLFEDHGCKNVRQSLVTRGGH